MREVVFIKRNKDKWLEIERVIGSKSDLDPDLMSSYYLKMLSDLSFSQTYYPKSNTTVYLNHLVLQIYQKIYKTKRIESNKILTFFFKDIPLVCYRWRHTIYFSFALFFFFVFLGVLSCVVNFDFVRDVLGDAYVNQTLDNIKNGDPMAIYKSSTSLSSAISITINNIKVSLNCYFGGLLFGVFTFFISSSNAFMLGAFQYFFYKYDLFLVSVSAIWLHGAMEVFSIVISTSCGFILTQGLFFPKSYSRLDSLKFSGVDSIKIMTGVIPFFVFAGFIEGFLTRHYMDMPLALNFFIIISTLSLISYYFLVLPRVVHRKSLGV